MDLHRTHGMALEREGYRGQTWEQLEKPVSAKDFRAVSI